MELDRGEAGALALAISTVADVLIIDDSAGRRAAMHHGVTVTGALGIVLRAKKRGRIPSMAEVMDRKRPARRLLTRLCVGSDPGA